MNKRVLVVGAGKVAARKARGALDCGAEVRVVAPVVDPSMPQGVNVAQRPFVEADLDEVDLCFVATNSPELNARIVDLCRGRRILVNRADRGEEGDFTVPAVHRAGAITVAISASGSPRLAASVRDEIARLLDPAWGEMAGVVQRLRDQLLAFSTLSEQQRRPLLLELCSPDALQAYKQGAEPALKAHLRTRFSHVKELAAW